MESKEASYRPLMSPGSYEDDDTSNSSTSDFAGMLKKKSSWRQYITNPLLGAVMLLIALVTVLIFLVLFHKPSDLQCTKQLSMYCKYPQTYQRWLLNLTLPSSSRSRSSRIRRSWLYSNVQLYKHLPWPTNSRAWEGMGQINVQYVFPTDLRYYTTNQCQTNRTRHRSPSR